MAVLGEDGGLNVKLWVRNTQKEHPCTEPHLFFTYFYVKVGAGFWL